LHCNTSAIGDDPFQRNVCDMKKDIVYVCEQKVRKIV